MLLVIDITKGIQTQTAECLIIGEITCDMMLVVLNKIDLIEEAQRQSTIDKVINLSLFFFIYFHIIQLKCLSCSDDKTITQNVRINKIPTSTSYSLFSIIIIEFKWTYISTSITHLYPKTITRWSIYIFC